MRKLIFLTVVLSMLVAIPASAHCRTCDVNEYTYCLYCRDTEYNAAILCTLINNGYTCRLEGGCAGPAGEQCEFACIEDDHAQLRPRELKLKGDWELVAVKVTRTTDAEREKRRS